MILHISYVTWFWIGVPVRAIRCLPLSWKMLLAVSVKGFLIKCASSNTTNSQSCSRNDDACVRDISLRSISYDTKHTDALLVFWIVLMKSLCFIIRTGLKSSGGKNFCTSSLQCKSNDAGQTTIDGHVLKSFSILMIANIVSAWMLLPIPLVNTSISVTEYVVHSNIHGNTRYVHVIRQDSI